MKSNIQLSDTGYTQKHDVKGEVTIAEGWISEWKGKFFNQFVVA